MSENTVHFDAVLQHWHATNALRESKAMTALRETTSALEDAEMLTSRAQIEFLAFIASSIGTTRAIEVGVYTGASALAIAQILPEDGICLACDLTDAYVETAQKAWVEAGVNDRIDFRVGPALETLQSVLEDGQQHTFDFMYVDADKTNSKNYYELGLQLVRSGGIIAIDNMFYGGQVADDSCNDENTIATRALAAHLVADERVDYTLLPIGDGLALARIRTSSYE